MTTLETACAALDAQPIDTDTFLEAVAPLVSTFAGSFPDPDEVAQRALIKLHRSLAGCRARTPGRLRAWIRRVVRGCGCDAVRGGSREQVPLEAWNQPFERGFESGFERPVEDVLPRCFAAAVALDLGSLAAADRAWARRLRVARDPELRRTHLVCLERLRMARDPSAEIAADLGISAAAVKSGALRGAALLALTARVLADAERDPFTRGAYLRLAARGGVPRRPQQVTRTHDRWGVP